MRRKEFKAASNRVISATAFVGIGFVFWKKRLPQIAVANALKEILAGEDLLKELAVGGADGS